MKKKWKRLISLIMVASVTTISCMTSYKLPSPHSAPGRLEVGNIVQSETAGSKTHRFKVKETTSGTDTGDNIIVDSHRMDKFWKPMFITGRNARFTAIVTAPAKIFFLIKILAFSSKSLFID